jgi:hypothetical protein
LLIAQDGVVALGKVIAETAPDQLGKTLTDAVAKIEADAAARAALEVVSADIRKFSEYIFADGKAPGKVEVFRGLGYDLDDSAAMIAEYQNQAARKFAAGDYKLGKIGVSTWCRVNVSAPRKDSGGVR